MSKRVICSRYSTLWCLDIETYVSPPILIMLETETILLDIFEEKQQKTAEAGTIPTFDKKIFALTKFKPEQGSISHRVQRLAKYRFLKVSLPQTRIDMSEFDEDSDGFLQPHYFSFGYTYRKACIKKMLLSNCLQELMELDQESEEEITDTEQAKTCFFLHLRSAYVMDFESFLDFVLALENKDTPEGLTYLFIYVHQKWIEGGNYEFCIEDPADPLRITLADLLSCKQGGTVASMLVDARGFRTHDNRENLLREYEESLEGRIVSY
ncbi:hypothetical protein K2173_007813 [Erythroxylum novogranatense]|uniref:Uncharacterized protein n=1 Tax=Erythroxylum novogranatense TaxID=1862640 RepID=A0AAV8TIQ5_9ROSI|nr:hypothetical protein K2173_007813 [Erythroxylum novogranatense]